MAGRALETQTEMDGYPPASARTRPRVGAAGTRRPVTGRPADEVRAEARRLSSARRHSAPDAGHSAHGRSRAHVRPSRRGRRRRGAGPFRRRSTPATAPKRPVLPRRRTPAAPRYPATERFAGRRPTPTIAGLRSGDGRSPRDSARLAALAALVLTAAASVAAGSPALGEALEANLTGSAGTPAAGAVAASPAPHQRGGAGDGPRGGAGDGPRGGAGHGPRAGEGRVLSIAWVGDITPGSRYGLPPDDGDPLFAETLQHLRQPDLTFGNLEGTLSVGGVSKCGVDGGDCFSFQAPPGHAASLARAGFDLLNLANNHSLDFGEAGRRQTIAALREHDLRHTGLPDQVTVLREQGLRIAVLGFAPYEWASDLRDIPAARGLIRSAARRAELVVVLMHAGAEGSDQVHVPEGHEIALGEDRGDTRGFAHAAVEAGADLVLGSGPHVLRGIETRDGRLIAYSLGNFAGWENFSTYGTLGLSGILNARVSDDGRLRGGRFTPVRLEGSGIPVPDVTGAGLDLVREVGAQDFGDHAATLDEAGGIRGLRRRGR